MTDFNIDLFANLEMKVWKTQTVQPKVCVLILKRPWPLGDNVTVSWDGLNQDVQKVSKYLHLVTFLGFF